jgi:hypothetical protein
MKLVCLHFKAFAQSSDIKADIKQGWCAGITALVSATAGSHSIEDGLSDEAWALAAFKRIGRKLDGINSKSNISAAESLQLHLGKVDMKSVDDVCGEIHNPSFDGRECKVLLSLSSWVPLIGYASYVWNSKWVVNHIGYIIRTGKYMLIFDPNYGLGMFEITDSQPLTLKDLTNAVMGLAWSGSAADYYFSYTAAIAVVDEDFLGLRPTVKQSQIYKNLSEFSKKYSSSNS